MGVVHGDCLPLLRSIPSQSIQLVITSPPYNVGKEYEHVLSLDVWAEWQRQVIRECVRVLRHEGSICWQVGNNVKGGRVIPLDWLLGPIFTEMGMVLRNRIVWHFDHGLHASMRFSGRYETILWFTKSGDYYFDLDAVRILQKWPNKRHFKGPRKGELSCNPLGANPGDVWTITNVKNNHPEKTAHPCQFPEDLVDPLIRSLSRGGDTVLDPFAGSGTTLAVALKHRRNPLGMELREDYCQIIERRLASIQQTLPMEEAV